MQGIDIKKRVMSFIFGPPLQFSKGILIKELQGKCVGASALYDSRQKGGRGGRYT